MVRGMFKSKKAFNRAMYLHPLTIMIMMDMYLYCMNKDLEFIVTDTVSTLEEDKHLGRISSSHRSGRAFDLRNRSWDTLEIKKFENHFNEKYMDVAAMDRNGFKRLVVSIPHGTGPHFHVQIHKEYSLDIQLESLAYLQAPPE